MSSFGSAEFGPAVFGGDPSGPSGLLFDVDAEVTATARRFLARGATDGTAIQVREFTIGQGGLDPFNYRMAVPVNPNATDLELPLTIPLVVLSGTFEVNVTSTTITTTDDHTALLSPGDMIEITTGSGTQVFTIVAITATTIETLLPSLYTDLLSTGKIWVEVSGAKLITQHERPNPRAVSAYCQLDATEANERLGEIAIWAKVISSPFVSEIGDVFCAAIGHFPLICKNDSMRYAIRVNVQF